MALPWASSQTSIIVNRATVVDIKSVIQMVNVTSTTSRTSLQPLPSNISSSLRPLLRAQTRQQRLSMSTVNLQVRPSPSLTLLSFSTTCIFFPLVLDSPEKQKCFHPQTLSLPISITQTIHFAFRSPFSHTHPLLAPFHHISPENPTYRAPGHHLSFPHFVRYTTVQPVFFRFFSVLSRGE